MRWNDGAIADAAAGDPGLVGVGPAAQHLRRTIREVAACHEPVLIRGETGAGKEVVARAIHAASPRHDAPFIAVNVCALADPLLESALFGHERGAFTGAHTRRIGHFERAAGGTLLLDEIGDASLALQAKLLRAVEGAGFERVGGGRPLQPDVRILAATHRDLVRRVGDGAFREDLWYRLCGLEIEVPPLRRHPEDIGAIAEAELALWAQAHRKPAPRLTAEALARLEAHAWPGNVRELRLTLRRMLLLASDAEPLRARHAAAALLVRTPRRAGAGAGAGAEDALDGEPDAEGIRSALRRARGNVSAAARELGIGRGALRYRMDRLGIGGPDRRVG